MNGDEIMFPKPGTKVTYAEALRLYDDLEADILSRVYAPEFVGNVKIYDLMWHLESIASKYGIVGGASFRSLRDLMYRFSVDRTALANGVNGKRFYVLNDSIALARHDETHFFEVLVDGERLRLELGNFLAALQKEASSGDEYADTYSPDWPNRKEAIRREPKARVEKIMIAGFLAIAAILFVCLIWRSVSLLNLCSMCL